jgi:Uma2 family endonuclease
MTIRAFPYRHRTARLSGVQFHNGDRLTQPKFHRLYEATPPEVKAELIGGIVYITGPKSLRHGEPHASFAAILGNYEAATPGVEAGLGATVILGEESEPEPDLYLRLLPQYGGMTRVNEDEYLVGPPELVIEIAHSSVAIDLHAKRLDYEKAGVLEYLVLCVAEGELRPFDLKTGRELTIEDDGVFRSKVFPGLWIDAAAILSGDTRRLLSVLQKGLKSTGHAAFVKELERRAAKASKPRPRAEGAKPRRPRKRGGPGRRRA